jgi:hypothetical protein
MEEVFNKWITYLLTVVLDMRTPPLEGRNGRSE